MNRHKRNTASQAQKRRRTGNTTMRMWNTGGDAAQKPKAPDSDSRKTRIPRERDISKTRNPVISGFGIDDNPEGSNGVGSPRSGLGSASHWALLEPVGERDPLGLQGNRAIGGSPRDVVLPPRFLAALAVLRATLRDDAPLPSIEPSDWAPCVYGCHGQGEPSEPPPLQFPPPPPMEPEHPFSDCLEYRRGCPTAQDCDIAWACVVRHGQREHNRCLREAVETLQEATSPLLVGGLEIILCGILSWRCGQLAPACWLACTAALGITTTWASYVHATAPCEGLLSDYQELAQGVRLDCQGRVG
jgi:hypothetical protein